MVSVSAEVVAVVDSSKFDDISFSVFALPHEINRIITDNGAQTATVDALRAQGITVDRV
jgi:DeoR/GlpR family transcriptional regulator of sugar metabolism